MSGAFEVEACHGTKRKRLSITPVGYRNIYCYYISVYHAYVSTYAESVEKMASATVLVQVHLYLNGDVVTVVAARPCLLPLDDCLLLNARGEAH